MIVLIAGMPRSGSTFTFNVAREILRACGTVHQEACDNLVDVVSRSQGADHVLVKAHNLDEQSFALARTGAIRVVMSVRRVEDALASFLNVFANVPDEAVCRMMSDWLAMARRLRMQSLVLPYEQIDRRPWLAAWRIAHSLSAGQRLGKVISIVRQFNKAEVKRWADGFTPGDAGAVDIGFSYYDHDTFFHRRHVSSLSARSPEQRLVSERLMRIRNRLDALDEMAEWRDCQTAKRRWTMPQGGMLSGG